jgi:hypothetical protein
MMIVTISNKIHLIRDMFGPRMIRALNGKIAGATTTFGCSKMMMMTTMMNRRGDILEPFRQEARIAVRQRDCASFVGCAYKMIETIWPSQFASYQLMDLSLPKAFQKICDAQQIPGGGTITNVSGRAIQGLVWDSDFALCAKIIAILLQNTSQSSSSSSVIVASIDYNHHKNQGITPFQAIVQQWKQNILSNTRQSKNLQMMNSQREWTSIERQIKPTMTSLLGHLTLRKTSAIFLANHILNVYTQDNIWCELHALANSMHHSVFLVDSSPKFHDIIYSHDMDAIHTLCGELQQPHTIQASLNETKITPWSLVEMMKTKKTNKSTNDKFMT